MAQLLLTLKSGQIEDLALSRHRATSVGLNLPEPRNVSKEPSLFRIEQMSLPSELNLTSLEGHQYGQHFKGFAHC
jgi:hypothetical protein